MTDVAFRVIHVFPHSAQLSGGHTNAVIKFMEGQLEHGLDVRGLCPVTRNIPEALRGKVDHLPILELDFNQPELWEKVVSLADGARNPLYHFHGFIPGFTPLGRRLNRAGIPYIVTSQGQLHYRDPLHWLKKFLYVNFIIPFFSGASGLHFVTRRERNRCRYLMPWWKKPVLVQQNVVKVPDPLTVQPASRAEHQLPAEAFLFAYVGRLHIEHKGLDLLVKGFAQLPVERGYYLLLIGPDWEGGRQRLEQLARKLAREKQVRFLGPQFGDTKWRMLKMADVFISPSRWDACPSAVTESIGFGMPTIVSSTMNPAPELVEGGAALAPEPTPDGLARAMAQLAGDAALREGIAARGRQWVLENCNLQVAGVRFDTFYREVLGYCGRSRPKAAAAKSVI
jgi:glycosyltransferase involved in cell wall biosynthesis